LTAGRRELITNPQAYGHSNLTGFLNILEACRHNGCEHPIFASSSLFRLWGQQQLKVPKDLAEGESLLCKRSWVVRKPRNDLSRDADPVQEGGQGGHGQHPSKQGSQRQQLEPSKADGRQRVVYQKGGGQSSVGGHDIACAGARWHR